MINSIYIILPEQPTPQELILTLNNIGKDFSWGNIGLTKNIASKGANLWLNLISLEEAGYDEKDVKSIEELLNASPKKVLQIEFNEDINCIDFIINIISRFEKLWPDIAIDNCFDKIFPPSEINSILNKKSLNS